MTKRVPPTTTPHRWNQATAWSRDCSSYDVLRIHDSYIYVAPDDARWSINMNMKFDFQRRVPLGLSGGVLVCSGERLEEDEVEARCGTCSGPAYVPRHLVEEFGRPDPPSVICQECITKDRYGEQESSFTVLPDGWEFEFNKTLDEHTLQAYVTGFDAAKAASNGYTRKLIEVTQSVQEMSQALSERISYCQMCGTKVDDDSGRNQCQKCHLRTVRKLNRRMGR